MHHVRTEYTEKGAFGVSRRLTVSAVQVCEVENVDGAALRGGF